MEHRTREHAIQNPHGVVGLAGFQQTIGDFPISTNDVFRIQLPQQFTSEDLDRMQTDFQLLADVLRLQRNRFNDLLAARMQNQKEVATMIAKELGLTEEESQAHGGGILLGVVAIVVTADVFVGA